MEEDINPGPHDWTGVLGAGASGLRLRLRAPDGFTGAVALFSLDQGGGAIPGQARTLPDGQVILDFPAIRGRFVGRDTGGRLEGVWRQGGEMPLTLTKGEAGLVRAQSAPLTADRLEALRAQSGGPAMIAAAQSAGQAPLILAAGRRAANRDMPVTTSDRWHVGSITKSMTATLAARLIEQGAMRWDDTVGGVLGGKIADIHAAYRPLLLAHLLSHRSGISDQAHPMALLRFHTARDPLPAQRLALSAAALKAAPKAEPGAAFEYSNFGYVVAGAMLEVKTGRTWEDLMRDQLFAPLGMPGAGFGAPGVAGALDEPLGHSKAMFGDARTPHRLGGGGITDNPPVLGPAGTVHARASDMLAYLAAHRDKPAFLHAQSWARLHAPPFGGPYAMGWEVRPDGLWHNGSNTLWYAEAQVSATAVGLAATNDGWLEKAVGPISAALDGAISARSSR
jgi:CubicO group peptidase (beta-lactamase class C family)